MKKLILLFAIFNAHIAQADCFIAQEKDKILIQEGKCKTAYSPESTSSMGGLRSL